MPPAHVHGGQSLSATTLEERFIVTPACGPTVALGRILEIQRARRCVFPENATERTNHLTHRLRRDDALCHLTSGYSYSSFSQDDVMSAYPQFRAAAPRVTRIEMADLYVGDATTAVQLDAIPCEAWIQNLQALLSASPELGRTRVEVEGSWVHFIGVPKAGSPVASHLLDLIAAAGHMAYAPAVVRTSSAALKPVWA